MNDEIQALRRMAQVLARVATPLERQNIARRVAQKAKGDESELALTLAHAAALFWPGDDEKTAEVLQQITLAFDAGELGGFIPREHRHILFTDLTVWPDCPPMAADSPLRFWVPDAPAQPQAATPVPVADSASDAPVCDFSMLATRDQLIDAFGRFTDMDASWFNNLKDTPALLTARKVAGQGGRGHIAEPWFCPFEVMQWLADSKRRKGRKLSAEKAWGLLEKNFPKVYNARSVADPRAGD